MDSFNLGYSPLNKVNNSFDFNQFNNLIILLDLIFKYCLFIGTIVFFF